MPAALLLLVVSVRRSSSGSFRKAASFYFGTPWAVNIAIIKIVYFQNFGHFSPFHSEFSRNMPRGSERFPNQNN